MKAGRSPDLAAALEALGPEELRSFIREALDDLDDGPRGRLEDALLRRAASAGAGWRPAAPSPAIVGEVESFAEAACQVGQAEPSEVDGYLRQGVTASLAADHDAARAVFEALLPPIADGGIYLGQHEMVDEVLSVDLGDCVARYLAAAAAWRGDFLDGAALAAQVLERKDATRKLEAAWLGAPSLTRILRWLLADEPSSATLMRRAASALAASTTRSPRLLGLLHLVRGDVPAAAALLKEAPGLGWSCGDHPGHLLFSALAWMFGGAPPGSVRERFAQALHRSVERDLGSLGAHGGSGCGEPATPRLSEPTVADALRRAEVMANVAAAHRASALAAMKAAAVSRTEGVLGEKRRRHYEHAALLVACCVELEGAADTRMTSAWAESIRARTSRYPAFQQALRTAMEQARC